MNSQYASASAMVAYGKSAIRRRTRRPESYYDPLALCETPDDYLGVYYRNLPRDLRGEFENSWQAVQIMTSILYGFPYLS